MHYKSYEQHLRDSKGCGHRWRILFLKSDVDKRTSENLSRIRIVPVRCNSKACPTCSRTYFRKIRHRFKVQAVNQNWRFFTLTTIHQGKPNEKELQHLEESFRELRKQLRRQNKNYLYFAVKELSPSGMWHIHGLWNIFIDVKELSKLWQKYSGAYRVDVRKVKNPKGAVNYLFKYIFKSSYNDDEKRLLFENDKRKFSYSRALFSKVNNENPYTTDMGIDYSVPELKEELVKMVRHTDYGIDDFDGSEYPYFEDLIFNAFDVIYTGTLFDPP